MSEYGPDDEDDESGDSPEVYRTSWDRSDPDALTTAIVQAVATVRDTDPMSVTRPLSEAVDADALLRLMASADGDGSVQVTFEYDDLLVTVADDGRVTVQPVET